MVAVSMGHLQMTIQFTFVLHPCPSLKEVKSRPSMTSRNFDTPSLIVTLFNSMTYKLSS